MTQLNAKLAKCTDLEASLRELGVNEIAILDTNVLIKGAFPWYKPLPGQSKKHEMEVVHWMKNWREMQTLMVPGTTDIIEKELYNLHNKLWHTEGPVKSFFDRIKGSNDAFYVSLSGEAHLPEDIFVDLTAYSKNGNKPNDTKILAVAYALCKNTNLNVTLISGDGDFNPMLQETLGKYCTEDGRYVRLETPEDFRKRTGLITARKIA
jgi:hypothetical protein